MVLIIIPKTKSILPMIIFFRDYLFVTLRSDLLR